MSRVRILVAGVGNIFLGDDAFGSEVARAMARDELPDGVRVIDYGIGGVHLAHDIADGVGTLILIDTVPHVGRPGDVAVFEVDGDELSEAPVLDSHGLDPAAVLAAVVKLGGSVPRTLVVGCQPADLGEGIGLSEAVLPAVEPARRAVLELIEAELAREGT